jgi:histidyl-tRNA synthetase
MEFGEKSLKSLMKSADRLKAAHVLIIGDKELDERAAVLRDMQTKEQTGVPFDQVVDTLKAAARKPSQPRRAAEKEKQR